MHHSDEMIQRKFEKTLKRSVLMPIEPIGIGTSVVESLLSYIQRLANVHCVSTRQLLIYIITTYMSYSNYISNKSIKTINFGRLIGGSNRFSAELINTIEELTVHNNLINLTLSNWNGILSKSSTSIYRKWCSQCLKEMKNEGRCEHQLLIWNIKCVNICHIHNTPLTLRCNKCNSYQPTFNSTVGLSHCSKCKSWLGNDLSLENEGLDEINERELWIAKSIGRLLEFTPNIVSFPTRVFPKYFIIDLENKSSKNNILNIYDIVKYWNNYSEDKADDYRMGPGNLRRFINGHLYKNTDTLEFLLHFLYYIDAPIDILINYHSFDLSSLSIVKKIEELEVESKVMEVLIKKHEEELRSFYNYYNTNKFKPETIEEFKEMLILPLSKQISLRRTRDV